MIKLILAKPQDIPTIQLLGTKIWNEHYTPIIGEAQINYMLAIFYDEAYLLKQMEEGQIFYLIQNENKIEGFISVTETSPDEIFINKFYIDSRGKGIGRKTFETLLSLYHNAKTIRLNVNKNNIKSINFYFKIGFIIEKTFIFDIGEGYYMDDFGMVMQKKG